MPRCGEVKARKIFALSKGPIPSSGGCGWRAVPSRPFLTPPPARSSLNGGLARRDRRHGRSLTGGDSLHFGRHRGSLAARLRRTGFKGRVWSARGGGWRPGLDRRLQLQGKLLQLFRHVFLDIIGEELSQFAAQKVLASGNVASVRSAHAAGLFLVLSGDGGKKHLELFIVARASVAQAGQTGPQEPATKNLRRWPLADRPAAPPLREGTPRRGGTAHREQRQRNTAERNTAARGTPTRGAPKRHRGSIHVPQSRRWSRGFPPAPSQRGFNTGEYRSFPAPERPPRAINRDRAGWNRRPTADRRPHPRPRPHGRSCWRRIRR